MTEHDDKPDTDDAEESVVGLDGEPVPVEELRKAAGLKSNRKLTPAEIEMRQAAGLPSDR